VDDRVVRALKASFWSQFPPEVAEAVFATAVTIDFPAGHVIEAQTGEGNIALVVDGLIRMFVRGKNERQATVRYCRTGEMLGLTALLAGPCHMGIQMITAGTLFGMPGEILRGHAMADARIAWAIAQDEAHRTYELAEEMVENTFGSVRQRVARHLLDLVVGEGDRLVAPISQQQLANAVGTVREVVSRVLVTFKGEGLLRVTPDGVEILNATELYAQSNA
jgi:CRP/FNR family cyclic AMP-dependent transcriptional regulator